MIDYPLAVKAENDITLSVESATDEMGVYVEVDAPNFGTDFVLPLRAARELHAWLGKHLSDE